MRAPFWSWSLGEKELFFLSKNICFFFREMGGYFHGDSKEEQQRKRRVFLCFKPTMYGTEREGNPSSNFLLSDIYIGIFFFFLHASYQLDSEKNVEERAQQTNKHEFLYLFMIGGGCGSFFLKKYGTARTLHSHM